MKNQKEKFWVIDVSNTFTKFALSNEKSLGLVSRYPTPKITVAWLRKLKKRSDRIYLSSVVPAKTKLIEKVFGAKCWSVRGDKDLGFPVRYPNKKRIGADRLANAAATRKRYGFPAVVVDFGTAVTFDVIDANGAYCGGVIAPGLNAMTDYLHEKTALLPRIEIREPNSAIGKSTEHAMLVGAVIGYRGLVREIVGELKKQLCSSVKVVATGGQAQLVAKGLPLISKVNPLLTLEGVRIMAVYQRRKHGK